MNYNTIQGAILVSHTVQILHPLERGSNALYRDDKNSITVFNVYPKRHHLSVQKFHTDQNPKFNITLLNFIPRIHAYKNKHS